MLAVTAFTASEGYKKMLGAGDQLLASLTGCKVKPKGTPHAEVSAKVPKLFLAYGSGLPGTNSWRPSPKSGGAVFDPVSGLWLKSIDTFFPPNERKRIEAGVRKPCETPTGDFSYYIRVESASDDRGVVRLLDGNLYAAAFYQIEGGTLSDPKPLAVNPIGGGIESGKAGQRPQQPASQASVGALGLGLLALLLLLPKKAGL